MTDKCTAAPIELYRVTLIQVFRNGAVLTQPQLKTDLYKAIHIENKKPARCRSEIHDEVCRHSFPFPEKGPADLLYLRHQLILRYQPAGLGQLSMCRGWRGSSRTDSCGLAFGLALTKEPPYPEIIAGKGKGGSEEGWRIPNGHQGSRGRRSWLVPVEGIKRLHLPP